jgi:hypothetical protein
MNQKGIQPVGHESKNFHHERQQESSPGIRLAKLSDMVKGWFVGHFQPSLFDTTDVEVAVKRYEAGDHECAHYHLVATEFTVIVDGEVEMSGVRYGAGDIVIVPPGVSTDFRALTPVTATVVKIPGAPDDKYPGTKHE